ncbi:hypothetical protein IKC_06410 [Bacillus cereus VD184]|uniref:Uncharacterized protein n=1 Tax=Bacillus cereus VD184 TaxID=1053242 RepID=A0A9W5R5R1_BACCE|nr:hypothetical protein IKC_06410 [Bacillus cereus VD184]
MPKTFQIDVEHYERSADILRVMDHSVRLRLMHEL